MSCDYYNNVPLPGQPNIGSTTVSKACIAVHGDMPVAYYRENTITLDGDSPVTTSYQITRLDFSTVLGDELFDFGTAAVCPGDITKKQSC